MPRLLKGGGLTQETQQAPLIGISNHDPVLVRLLDQVVAEDSWVLFQILRLDEETISIPVLIASSDPTRFEKTALGLEHHSGVEVIDKPYDTEMLYDKITALLSR